MTGKCKTDGCERAPIDMTGYCGDHPSDEACDHVWEVTHECQVCGKYDRMPANFEPRSTPMPSAAPDDMCQRADCCELREQLAMAKMLLHNAGENTPCPECPHCNGVLAAPSSGAVDPWDIIARAFSLIESDKAGEASDLLEAAMDGKAASGSGETDPMPTVDGVRKGIIEAMRRLRPFLDIDHSEECPARFCFEESCACPSVEDPTGTGEHETAHEEGLCDCTTGAIEEAFIALRFSIDGEDLVPPEEAEPFTREAEEKKP